MIPNPSTHRRSQRGSLVPLKTMRPQTRPLSYINPTERLQIQEALKREPKRKKKPGPRAGMEKRIAKADARYEREMLASAYAEARRRQEP
jgi:hypothetical protein